MADAEEKTAEQPVFAGALIARRDLPDGVGVQVVSTPVCFTSFMEKEEAEKWGVGYFQLRHPPDEGWQDHEAKLEQMNRVVMARQDATRLRVEAYEQGYAQGKDDATPVA